jgi:hypothetical protein
MIAILPCILRDRQIGEFLLKVRLAVPVERMLGRRAEATDSPHDMTIGQDMREATLVPIPTTAGREEQAWRLTTTAE